MRRKGGVQPTAIKKQNQVMMMQMPYADEDVDEE
jgi:hypothetical protein